MGAQMTKELGVYNEEEKLCTPQGPRHYRLLNIDPRSATAGIVRSPIQVERTPTSSIHPSASHPQVVNKGISSASLVEGNDNNKSSGSDVDMNDDCKLVNDDVDCDVKTTYLETDVDKLDEIDTKKAESNTQPITEEIVQLSDMRSPSLGISRTPLLVECTPELFALHARIESMSFCDVDINVDDPSAIVSDDDQSSHCPQSTVKNWLKGVENESPLDSLSNISFGESPKTVAKKQKELNALKKKLFLTPDVKEASKPKARTPLGNIQASHLGESPQKLMRAKQWRNIQEERQRRGIIDTENTPPSLPPLSKVSSAPGKMLDRRTKTQWDNENVMFI